MNNFHGLTECDVWEQAKSMDEKKLQKQRERKKVYTPFCRQDEDGIGGTVNTLENTTMHCTWTKKRTHGSMPPLCAYNIVVILQMDFVLLLRSINDWTHESQCGPGPVNHRPRGKKPHLIELLCR